MAKKVNKERIVSYRLTEEQYAPFGEIIEKAGISQSQFFRDMTLSKSPVFKESSKNYDHLLFLYNKSSNNLNQLAHRVNSAYRKSGVVSETLYIRTLNELALIRELLSAGLSHVD